MNIVLTGFNRFGELDVNPSQLIVERIGERALSDGRDGILTEVLRTDYVAAGSRVSKLIRQEEPDVVLLLGVARGRSAISLERVALNIDDSATPDNAGETRAGDLIVPDGPAAYWSSLPLRSLWDALHDREIPVSYSNHAGTFLCNHVFYLARHEIERARLDTQCGFVHVPLMCEQVDTSEAEVRSLPLEAMVQAIECCLDILQSGAAKAG
jgi:pyroglutamyl-peptidase